MGTKLLVVSLAEPEPFLRSELAIFTYQISLPNGACPEFVEGLSTESNSASLFLETCIFLIIMYCMGRTLKGDCYEERDGGKDRENCREGHALACTICRHWRNRSRNLDRRNSTLRRGNGILAGIIIWSYAVWNPDWALLSCFL